MPVTRIRRSAQQAIPSSRSAASVDVTDDNDREPSELEQGFGEVLAVAFVHAGPQVASEMRERIHSLSCD